MRSISRPPCSSSMTERSTARCVTGGLGLIGERVHALVFTETPKGIRFISFRKANKREV